MSESLSPSTYATVLLVEPLVDAQDAARTTAVGSVLGRMFSVLGLEAGSSKSDPGIYEALLRELGAALDEHVDVSPDGGDFISLAASQVGACLERASRGRDDPTAAWHELRAIYAALDDYLVDDGGGRRLLSWLTSVRASIDRAATAESVQVIVGTHLTEVRPYVEAAYRASNSW